MIKYIIKVTYTATDDNQNFKGCSMIAYDGKNNADVFGDIDEQHFAKFNGWDRKNHATRKMNFLKTLKERFWNKEYQIIEIEV